MLINNDTYQRETLSERPIRQPLRRTQNLGERLFRAKITQTQNSHTSLTPNMQNIDDSSSQVGSCPMSPTLKDLLDLLDET